MKKTFISLLAGIIGLAMMTTSAGETETAGEYLELFKQYNGRCMSLRRGDMRMIRNNHPEKVIEYRMIRELAGTRQASIIRDRIEPGEEGQALGCEKIDDLEQVWVITQARFVENP